MEYDPSQLPARVAAKISIDDNGCWMWTAYVSVYGYGRLRYETKNYPAHRFTYQWFVGEVEPGLDVDHLCRVRACCNPAHLEAVTRRENLLRGLTIPAMHAAKTECKSGHPFDATNTRIDPATGDRKCRACDKRNQQRYRDRRAA